jgi:hypothetical protein
MSYTRQPNSVLAGRALVQNPPANTTSPPGVLAVKLDANIATNTELGVVQVGAGLSVTPLGVLSVNSGIGLFPVKIANANYTALSTDYYIGANTSGITITLPAGITGKIYTVKNQVNGNITLVGTGGQQIDSQNHKNIGSNDCVIVLFNGTRWSIISKE